MKRLIICCDGTWNTPDQEQFGEPCPTNVVKIRNCIADRDDAGTPQVCYYHPGVGTEGGWRARVAGGVYGKGLDQNIKSAYHWLGTSYTEGDEVYLFGFSRGAYTVRSLGGMIGACGLLDLSDLDAHSAWHRVDTAYDRCYRVEPERRKPWADGDWAFHVRGKPIPIHFIGVWDTVGALGIPNDLGVLNLLDNPKDWRFHDTRLGESVQRARHAMALDEQRASFTPTLWTDLASGRDVKQVWFAGVHADVGGGYASCALSDIALEWMIAEASASQSDGKPGLSFRQDVVDQVRPEARGTIHDSVTGVFKALRTRPRAIPPICSDSAPVLHPSVLARQSVPPIDQAPYHPTGILGPGEHATVSVFARERWNATGLYLEPGEYTFAASGEWLDSRVECGPGGTKDGKFYVQEVFHAVGSAWGLVEQVWQRVTDNKAADFWGTRRAEDIPWFALVGVIANDGGRPTPDTDGSPTPHERFEVGHAATHTVKLAGYLYAFANDAWATYENNRGNVQLTVSRSE